MTRAPTSPAGVPDEIVLGAVEDFPPGSLRLVHAGARRLLVAATPAGWSVTDNACPHQGYGLVQGDLDDGTLTCAWHNWKYRVADGHCLRGEEDLRLYPATVREGTVVAVVADPPAEQTRARLTASLRRGLDDGYVGQMARDIVRLLRADADPVQLVWEAVAWGAPRAEFGFGHALASLVDCMHTATEAEGDARALPLVTAFGRIADTERRRPLRSQPEPLGDLPDRPGAAFRAAIEAEDLVGAEGLLRGAIAADYDASTLRRWLTGVVSDHHLSYGHAAIYVQKAFALLDRLGWERADTVLPHLVPAIGWATREDRLPYMRAFTRAVGAVDMAALATTARSQGWSAEGEEAGPLRDALLGRQPPAVVEAAVDAVVGGAGIEGLIDTVVAVGSHRLARYDPTAEVESDSTDFGWLDLTHVLTYASAARWAWRADPGPDTARLALWTAFQAHYAGRRGYVEITGDAADPVATTVESTPGRLCRAALEDRAGTPIFAAHLIKTASAAVVEAEATRSRAPLDAVARFVAAPRREASIALNVRKAIDLADGRVPA